MPSHYDDTPTMDDELAPPPKAPAPAKVKRTGTKMTDVQKAQLKKHMDKLDMSASEKKSHRMKMMVRMRKGMSVNKAHKDIMG